MVKIAVLGYGTVGSGVVEVIERNRMLIEKRVGKRLEVKYVLDIRDFPGDPYEDRIVHDAERILKDPEVKIICETMGGIEPAYTYSKRALEAGKSVCTSNKELVAAHGAELIALSEKHGCNYLFEASVGGGIPIIRPLNCALTAERVVEITGILNGTTNYILTRMEKDGADFGTVLKEAQQKGYAERNPEADVEGYDACRKIAILTSLIAGRTVDFGEIHTEGITGITPEDFQYARAMGRTIKLLAVSREEEDGPDERGVGGGSGRCFRPRGQNPPPGAFRGIRIPYRTYDRTGICRKAPESFRDDFQDPCPGLSWPEEKRRRRCCEIRDCSGGRHGG